MVAREDEARASVVSLGETVGRPRQHRLLLLAGALFGVCGATALGLTTLTDGVTRDILLAFGAALLSGSVIEVVFESFLESLINRLVERSAQEIKLGITEQTIDLARTSKSLEAMSQSGIFQVYSNRAAAAPDIMRNIIDPDVSNIRIIGISLNDFVAGQNSDLGQAWKVIVNYVHGRRGVARHARPLDIKVLAIDPDCLGAELRARAEARDFFGRAGRLKDDVENAVEALEQLKTRAAGNSDVLFDYRLYILPPILFLCRTNETSFVQQYHFWSCRDANVPPIPVVGYRSLSGPGPGCSMHDDVVSHFDWVWDNASVEGPKGAKQTRTIDKAVHQLGVQNVFVQAGEALEYMRLLLRAAKRRVYIQGVSLKSFFDPRLPLFREMADIADRQIDLKVLLLDPQCEQARYRSYKEHLFDHSGSSLGAYQSGGFHEQSTLVIDTRDTMARICQRLSDELAKARIQVKTYSSAPACFMLLVDDTVLVEQYVYGKVVPDTGHHEGTILGRDMPLVEYSLQPSKLFSGADPLRNPFKLLLDHFEFVFDKCAKPLVC